MNTSNRTNKSCTKFGPNRPHMTEEEWIEFDKTRYKTWYEGAGMIIFNKKRTRVLLVKDAVKGIWSFPKGVPEKEDGEVPLTTAIRETKEETGLEYNIDYILDSLEPVLIHYNRYFYTAIISTNANNVETDGLNESSFMWLSRDKIKTPGFWNKSNTSIRQFINTIWKYNKYKPITPIISDKPNMFNAASKPEATFKSDTITKPVATFVPVIILCLHILNLLLVLLRLFFKIE